MGARTEDATRHQPNDFDLFGCSRISRSWPTPSITRQANAEYSAESARPRYLADVAPEPLLPRPLAKRGAAAGLLIRSTSLHGPRRPPRESYQLQGNLWAI